jgi:hypothetical protein
MNKQAAARYMEMIAKSLSKLCQTEVNTLGIIFPDDIGDSLENESLWVDGWDFTAWIVFDTTITNSEILKCQKFLSREVYTKQVDLSGSNATKIYFGEGIRYFVPQSITTTQHTSDVSITGRLETKITIPAWIDNIVNRDLGGTYAPDYKKFARNLNLSLSEARVYLATYGLRSFGEAKIILSNLLSNNTVRASWLAEQQINILDFGSGTGGNLAAIIIALGEAYPTPPRLRILSVDGNENMLSLQKDFLERIIPRYNAEVKVEYLHHRATSLSDLMTLATIAGSNWHLITSFKCLSEIISIPAIYYEFAKAFSIRLHEKGIMLLLDVTTKDNLPQFNPILMNQEITRLERESQLKTLLPIPCYLHSATCFGECFGQQQFLISHSLKKSDISKVYYRILGSQAHVSKIHNRLNQGRYLIKWRYSSDGSINGDGVCQHCSGQTTIIDAYYLNTN